MEDIHLEVDELINEDIAFSTCVRYVVTDSDEPWDFIDKETNKKISVKGTDMTPEMQNVIVALALKLFNEEPKFRSLDFDIVKNQLYKRMEIFKKQK